MQFVVLRGGNQIALTDLMPVMINVKSIHTFLVQWGTWLQPQLDNKGFQEAAVLREWFLHKNSEVAISICWTWIQNKFGFFVCPCLSSFYFSTKAFPWSFLCVQLIFQKLVFSIYHRQSVAWFHDCCFHSLWLRECAVSIPLFCWGNRRVMCIYSSSLLIYTIKVSFQYLIKHYGCLMAVQ